MVLAALRTRGSGRGNTQKSNVFESGKWHFRPLRLLSLRVFRQLCNAKREKERGEEKSSKGKERKESAGSVQAREEWFGGALRKNGGGGDAGASSSRLLRPPSEDEDDDDDDPFEGLTPDEIVQLKESVERE